MSGKWRAFAPGAGVAQGRKIDTFDESLTGAEQNWRYGDVHIIDQAVAKILLNDVDASAHPHVFVPRSLAGALKSDGSAFCDEVESRSAFHLDGRARG